MGICLNWTLRKVIDSFLWFDMDAAKVIMHVPVLFVSVFQLILWASDVKTTKPVVVIKKSVMS